MAALSQIYIYPVKSLGGIVLTELPVEARGLMHDRRWMLVDADNRFLTQREYPRLALVSPTVGEKGLTLAAPGMTALCVPLVTAGKTETVRVWRSVCEAVSVGEEAAKWFTRYLGRPARLMFMPDETRRAVNPDYGKPDDIVSFADGYPLLLLGEATVQDLNARLDNPVPMDRFRPNLVVADSAPYAEDGWKRIAVGSAVFRVVKPCDRCVMTTIDQATAARGVEPLHTLAQYRTSGGKVLFGQYLIAEGTGAARLGDTVTVLDQLP